MGILTYNDLADIYGKETGGTARVQPIDKIMQWAETRPDLFTFDEEGYLHLKSEVDND